MQRPTYPRLSSHPLVFAAMLAAYCGFGRLGLVLAGPAVAETAVWPQSGFALAVMIVLGRSIWPAVFVGAFIVYSMQTGLMAPSLVCAAGNTLETVVASALINRFAGGVDVFCSPRTIFRFAAFTGVCATPISATLTAFAATISGNAAWIDFGYVSMNAWLASLTGIYVITPIFVLLATTPWRWDRWLVALEALLLLGLLGLVSAVVFAGQFPSDVKNYPLEFLCVPLLLWAAFRFGRRQVAMLTLVLSGVAIWGTLRGFGPFARDSANEALVLVQAYTAVMAIMGLVLAAVVAEHKHAENRLRELATTDPLTGLVNYRRLIDVLRAEIARSQRTQRPFAVLFLDLNGLKKINDKHGHLVGSRAIVRVADALRRSCRTIDTMARYGGDEFAVVLPETSDDGGRAVLRRVAERLAADQGKPPVSVSGGISVYPRDGDSPSTLLRSADHHLYEAKASRRRAVGDTIPPRQKTGALF